MVFKLYINPISGLQDDVRDHPDLVIVSRKVSMPYVFVHSYESKLYVLAQHSGLRPHHVLGKYVEKVDEDYDLSRGDALRVDDGKGGHLARIERIDMNLEKRILESIVSPLGMQG